MFIETRGSGPPLVLIHGWAMHGGVFAPLFAALETHFTLHLVDLPGHGHSRDVAMPLALEAVSADLLERLPRALWLGWSLGGLFALQAALQQPDAVQGLIMICATPRFVRGDGDGGNGDGEPWPYGVSAAIFRDFGAGLRDDYRATLERFAALEAFGSDDARHALRMLRGELFARGEPAAAVLADGLKLLEHTDLRAALPSLSVPSLWLAGRRDRLVDPRAMRRAAQMTPGGSFAQVEHAGHAPFLTQADEVAQRIVDFAGSLIRHPREGGDPAPLSSELQFGKALDDQPLLAEKLRLRGNDELKHTS